MHRRVSINKMVRSLLLIALFFVFDKNKNYTFKTQNQTETIIFLKKLIFFLRFLTKKIIAESFKLGITYFSFQKLCLLKFWKAVNGEDEPNIMTPFSLKIQGKSE